VTHIAHLLPVLNIKIANVSVYYFAIKTIAFSLVFTARRNAAFALWRQGENYNDWLYQLLYHIKNEKQERVLKKN
jgi:hypothetical protein